MLVADEGILCVFSGNDRHRAPAMAPGRFEKHAGICRILNRKDPFSGGCARKTAMAAGTFPGTLSATILMQGEKFPGR